MIKALVFDLDDTLFPEHQFVLSGFSAVSAWVEKRYDSKGFLGLTWQLFVEGCRGRLFDVSLERMGIVPDATLIQTLLRIYREHVPIISLYEDAKWALDYLRGSRQLGIITDGYLATQKNKVASLQIGEMFDAIIYSDEFGRDNWKPSRVPYIKAMEQLGCNGAECAYIGDNLTKDFIAAKQLGWQAIHIIRPDGEYPAVRGHTPSPVDYQITSLYELKQLL
ncbi:MAG: HAD family hydrolase [Anaerolineaceae bacterium]|nr:HAD family hydrolase [Anaerolineaceae bacterium]